MSAAISSRSPGAMLILDLQDQFARKRGFSGAHPRPLGRVRFLLVARTDKAMQASVRLPAPLEMQVIQNPSGYYLFFGKVKATDGSTRRVDAQGWPWTIRLVSDFYQTMEQTPAEIPASFAPGSSGSGAVSPITFVLSPGPAYPFPNEPAGEKRGRLRGTLRNPDGSPIPGVRVEAIDVDHQPQFDPARTGEDGQWVLVLPSLPSDGFVNVRFTFADGTVKDVTQVPVEANRENNLPQTVLRGQVRLRNAGAGNAAIRVDKVKGAQTVTDAAGNWFLYLDLLQGGGKVTVIAKLPDQKSSKSTSVTVQPRLTVAVPSFDF